MISFGDMITRDMPEIMLNDNVIHIAGDDILIKIAGGNFNGCFVTLSVDGFLSLMRNDHLSKKYFSIYSGRLNGLLRVAAFKESDMGKRLDTMEAKFRDQVSTSTPPSFLYHRAFSLVNLDPCLLSRMSASIISECKAHYAEETQFILDGNWLNANGNPCDRSLLQDDSPWAEMLHGFCFCEIIRKP